MLIRIHHFLLVGLAIAATGCSDSLEDEGNDDS